MQAHTTTQSNIFTQLSRALLGMIGLLFFTYLFLIGSSVMNVSERKSAEQTIEQHRAELATLEEHYAQESSAITIEYARELGFVDIDHLAFVESTPAASLAFGTPNE